MIAFKRGQIIFSGEAEESEAIELVKGSRDLSNVLGLVNAEQEEEEVEAEENDEEEVAYDTVDLAMRIAAADRMLMDAEEEEDDDEDDEEEIVYTSLNASQIKPVIPLCVILFIRSWLTT